MKHTEEYKGRTIEASTRERRGGRTATYTWDYVILPDMIQGQCGDHALESEEIMLREAISEAKWRIDNLPLLVEKPLGT